MITVSTIFIYSKYVYVYIYIDNKRKSFLIEYLSKLEILKSTCLHLDVEWIIHLLDSNLFIIAIKLVHQYSELFYMC